MTAVLEELEYRTWHLAAEPSQDRMDSLLRFIVEHAPELAEVTDYPVEQTTTIQEPEVVRAIATIADAEEVVPGSPEGRGDVPDTLFCPKCARDKPMDDFGNDKSSRRWGKRYTCKACDYAARALRKRQKAQEAAA